MSKSLCGINNCQIEDFRVLFQDKQSIGRYQARKILKSIHKVLIIVIYIQMIGVDSRYYGNLWFQLKERVVIFVGFDYHPIASIFVMKFD